MKILGFLIAIVIYFILSFVIKFNIVECVVLEIFTVIILYNIFKNKKSSKGVI